MAEISSIEPQKPTVLCLTKTDLVEGLKEENRPYCDSTDIQPIYKDLGFDAYVNTSAKSCADGNVNRAFSTIFKTALAHRQMRERNRNS